MNEQIQYEDDAIRQRAHQRSLAAKRRRKRQLRKRIILSFSAIFLLLMAVLIGKGIMSLVGESTVDASDKTSAEEKKTEQENTTEKEAETVTEAVAASEVAAPVDYTREEIIAHLEEMAATDNRYTKIVENVDTYPEALLRDLVNNPEMLKFVQGYPSENVTRQATLTAEEKDSDCPLFMQWDQRWGYQAYGEDNIAVSGCGPTALSMVVVGLTHDETVTPASVAEYAMANGYYALETGTTWLLMTEGLTAYGVNSTEVSNSEEAMKAALDEGKYIICSMDPGDFTTAGHFIVVRGYDEEGFMINDSFCLYRSQQKWTYEQLGWQISGMWAVGK